LDHIGHRDIGETRLLAERAELLRSQDAVAPSEPAAQDANALADSTQAELKSARPSVRAVPEGTFRQITERVTQSELSRSPQQALLCLHFLDLLHSLAGQVVIGCAPNVGCRQLIAAPK